MSRDTKALKRLYRRGNAPRPTRQPFRAWCRELAAYAGDDAKRLAEGWLRRKGLRQ
jgi:hypothetical protein